MASAKEIAEYHSEENQRKIAEARARAQAQKDSKADMKAELERINGVKEGKRGFSRLASALERLRDK